MQSHLFGISLKNPGAVRFVMSTQQEYTPEFFMDRLRNGKRVKVGKSIDWLAYPVGTICPAIMSGYWHRVEDGWKWHLGDTFPGPGADNCGVVIFPVDPNIYEGQVRMIVEMLAYARFYKDCFLDAETTPDYVIKSSWDRFDNRDMYIRQRILEARAMIAEMAKELIIYAYGSVADYEGMKKGDHPEVNTHEFDQYLIDRGLIPSPSKSY